MFITPLTLVYDDFKDRVIILQLAFDVIWMIGIGLTFLTTSYSDRNLSSIAKSYLRSGLFFIDLFSTVPAMVTLEKNNLMSFFKFLRLIRFSSMFTPFLRLMKFSLTWMSSYQINDSFELLVIFFAVFMTAHMSACVWIYLGHYEDDLPVEDRHTWRFNGDFGSDFEGYSKE